jgi:signal transduction histidine kinase
MGGTLRPWDHRTTVPPANPPPPPPPWPTGQPRPPGPWGRGPRPDERGGPGRNWRTVWCRAMDWRGWTKTRRPLESRLAGGVAGAVGSQLGLDTNLVRLAFVLLSFAGGIGIAGYVLGWWLIPSADGELPLVSRAFADRRTVAETAAAVSVLIAVVIVSGILAGTFFTAFSPGDIGLAGLVAVWRQGTPEDQALLRRVTHPLGQAGTKGTRTPRWAGAVRVVIGLGLVVIGSSSLVAPHQLTRAVLIGVLAAIAVPIGFLVVFGPWWLRLGREMVEERRASLRNREREEMAAHLHDSVLQTLALIQRSADNPREVTRLARVQERQLRTWLFGGERRDAPDHMAAAIAVVEQEVEADHGVPVEAVTVGDAEMDDRLRALVAAAREATVNAAKWSGAGMVSLFAEVEDSQVSVYVRDRGLGFDPEEVPKGHKGIEQSIKGRMARHGGTVVIRSAFGEGTEVTLRMPRKAS